EFARLQRRHASERKVPFTTQHWAKPILSRPKSTRSKLKKSLPTASDRFSTFVSPKNTQSRTSLEASIFMRRRLKRLLSAFPTRRRQLCCIAMGHSVERANGFPLSY